MNTNPTSITAPIKARYHKGILTLLDEVDLFDGEEVAVRFEIPKNSSSKSLQTLMDKVQNRIGNISPETVEREVSEAIKAVRNRKTLLLC